MPTFLFDKIIFGPVQSRRLGNSLGINLLPLESKLCNFDCIYCECGRTYKSAPGSKKYHTRSEVQQALNDKLLEMKFAGDGPDVITFAGNGEPTMHPEFEGIIDDTLKLRDQIFPEARIAVLSNSVLLSRESVFNALGKIDDNIMKLDGGLMETIELINNPPKGFNLDKLKENLKKFRGKLIIQTMFLKGTYKGVEVNNTTEKELELWQRIVEEAAPRQVMIYTVARDTPEPDLHKVSIEQLNSIADRLIVKGFDVQVSG